MKAKSLPRPEKIAIIGTIKQRNLEDTAIVLAAAIHVVDGDEAPTFVAIRNSPWDNDTLTGSFDIAQFLFGATFRSSDDIESDSLDTQSDYYRTHVRREVDDYFRRPQAALLGILHNSLPWEARDYAKRIGVEEIHFRRENAEGNNWKAELVLANGLPSFLESAYLSRNQPLTKRYVGEGALLIAALSTLPSGICLVDCRWRESYFYSTNLGTSWRL